MDKKCSRTKSSVEFVSGSGIIASNKMHSLVPTEVNHMDQKQQQAWSLLQSIATFSADGHLIQQLRGTLLLLEYALCVETPDELHTGST